MHSHIASLHLDGHVRRQLARTVEKHGMCIVGNYGLPTHGFNRLPYSLPLERGKKKAGVFSICPLLEEPEQGRFS